MVLVAGLMALLRVSTEVFGVSEAIVDLQGAE